MKRVILCPNPYRDSELTVAKRSRELLEGLGFETVVCLPFSREGYDDQLGVPIRQLQQEIKRADMLIAFGGDGTICIWPGQWRCTMCRCWASIWGALALCPSWSPTSWNGCVT